jgi:mucin-2
MKALIPCVTPVAVACSVLTLLSACISTVSQAPAGASTVPAQQGGFQPVKTEAMAPQGTSTETTPGAPPPSTETVPGSPPPSTETIPGTPPPTSSGTVVEGTVTAGTATVSTPTKSGTATTGQAQVGPATTAGPVDTTPPDLTPEREEARRKALEQSNQPGPRP